MKNIGQVIPIISASLMLVTRDKPVTVVEYLAGANVRWGAEIIGMTCRFKKKI